MRLHLNFVEKVKHVGDLALVGTAVKYGGKGEYTIVTFALTYEYDAPMAPYFYPRGGHSQNNELLYAIFVGEGISPIQAIDDENQHFLIFTLAVEGRLRESRKFLHATAQKLLRELQAVEDEELTMREEDAQLEWAEYSIMHPGRRGPMPDFTRPRHE